MLELKVVEQDIENGLFISFQFPKHCKSVNSDTKRNKLKNIIQYLYNDIGEDEYIEIHTDLVDEYNIDNMPGYYTKEDLGRFEIYFEADEASDPEKVKQEIINECIIYDWKFNNKIK